MRPQPCATNVGAIALAIMNGPLKLTSMALRQVSAPADLVEFFPRPDEHVADVLHAHAGVVDEAVHGAEALDRRRDGGAARLPTRDVAIDGMDALLQLLRAGEVDELAHGRLARRQIGDRHAHARLGETERHGAPEAARAAGHG